VLQTVLANFREGCSGDYGVKTKPAKLRGFCELEWPAFNAGWPAEGTLDLVIITHIRNIAFGDPRHPDQFPYIDSWYILVAHPPDWICFHAPQRPTTILVNGKVKEKKFEVHHTSESESSHLPPYVLPVCPATPASPRPESNEGDPNGKEGTLGLDLHPCHPAVPSLYSPLPPTTPKEEKNH
jgi:hypothetical protein